MANLAQSVNVLQSVILTKGDKMLLTPTYYVMCMYRPHQGATMLPVELQSPDYKFNDISVPAVSASASRNAAGEIHLSLTNADPHKAISVECALVGATPAWKVSGEVITADQMNAHNEFDQPANVKPVPFNRATMSAGTMSIELPAMSVIMLKIERAATPTP
jgi:alpha-N-arabinofuranosidase